MIIWGDAYNEICKMKNDSVDCVITSPPYYGLRDYGIDGQIGREDNPFQYITHMAIIFEQVKRVLKSSGTFWLNIGDSYSVGGRGAGTKKLSDKQSSNHGSVNLLSASYANGRHSFRKAPLGFKQKELLGIPWRLALILQSSGWYLRQDIIWHKPNPMPESVRDRCTRSHEYIFMFSKNKKYFYDANAIKEPAIYGSPNAPDKIKSPYSQNLSLMPKRDKQSGHSRRHAGFNARWDKLTRAQQCTGFRNKRSVWTIAPAQFRQAHFATFPEKLIEPMILAGCPNGGVVLDPFCGSGTTGLVCKKTNREFIGIELNKKYVQMAERRIAGCVA